VGELLIGYRARLSRATLGREVMLLFFVAASPHDLALQILFIVVVLLSENGEYG
jgi:hypothetical protein